MTKSHNHIDLEIGNRIRSKRLEKGLSQTELGDRVNLTFQQIQKYEKGRNSTRTSKLFEIAFALGVDVDYFLRGLKNVSFNYLQDQQSAGEAANNYFYDCAVGETYYSKSPTESEINSLIKEYKDIINPEIRKNVMEIIKSLSRASI